VEIRAIRTEGLGDTTYIVAHGGVGVVIDPQRDVDRFLPAIDELGVELRWVLETHLHNDYISGARDLARALQAELVLPAGAAPVYRHTAAFHNEELSHNGLTIRPIHTPGHTPEHMSYLLVIDEASSAVFSGGSLLVGSAGRSDLLGIERSDTLARLQYQSVNRLGQLPDDTGLYPTHGAGSFCTATVASSAHSTIGVETRANPVFSHPDEDTFVAAHLSGLAPYPSYYQHMGPANVQGLPAPDLTAPPNLTEVEFGALGDVVVVDARPKRDFADGHIPGSLGIELRSDFGVWVGWIAPFNSHLVLVLNRKQDVGEAQRQLARIGFDRIEGVVRDVNDWAMELAGHQVVDAGMARSLFADGTQLLDVRAPSEWTNSASAGITNCYVPDLVDFVPASLDPTRPVLIACETGYRASIAASLVATRGYEPIVLVDAGVPELLTSG
jgi:glyoxylase-like metal-dependent hydrolase (beta-lactamase superfamily II)/rhodanese-related sulfurtransferase